MGVILFSEGQVPIALEALSDDPLFKNTMYFGHTREKQSEKIIRGFGVRKYPTLIAFEVLNDNLEILPVEMQGDIYNYTALQKFLKEQLNSYYSRAPKLEQEDIEEEEIEVFTSSRFSKCTDGQTSCVMFIYNQEKFGKISKDHIRMMKKMSVEFRRKSVPLIFGWLDGGCYPDVLEKIGLTTADLPTMILYSNNNQSVGKLDGELSYEKAREKVVDLLVQGAKDSLDTPAEGFNISDRKCKQFRTDIGSAGTDAERKEIIANFQKKEQERASNSSDEGSGKKDKKKKKKKSKSDL